MNFINQLIGHAHQIVIHLPIGWLFAVLFLDLIGLREKKVKSVPANPAGALAVDLAPPGDEGTQSGIVQAPPVIIPVPPAPGTAVRAGLWMLIGTVLAYFPAVLTGLLHERAFAGNTRLLAVIEQHETLMSVSLGLVVSALVLRLVSGTRLRGGLKGAYMALILAAVGVVIVGAWFGGTISH